MLRVADDQPHPGRLARALAALLQACAGRRHAPLLGDLREAFERRWRDCGPREANRWYRRQLVQAVGPVARRRMKGVYTRTGGGGMAGWFADLRVAARVLARRPGAALVAALTFALGAGANAAVFSIVDGILLRPLPFTAPDRLVLVWGAVPDGRERRVPLATAERAALAGMPGVEALTGFGNESLLLLDDAGDPVRVPGTFSDGDLLGVLGVAPLIGRAISNEEYREGADVVVLGHDLWTSRYGADPSVVGRTLRTVGRTFTVVGVAPPGVDFPDGAALWKTPPTWSSDGAVRYLARMTPGTRLDDLNAMLAARTVTGRIGARDSLSGLVPWAEPLLHATVGDVRTPLYLLLGAAGLVLLLATANLANLLLARARLRAREWRLRAALGCPARRLVRLVVTEGMLLAGVGCMAGLLVVRAAFNALMGLVPPDLPRADAVTLDARVVGVAFAVALLAGAIASALPAADALRVHRRSGAGRDPGRAARTDLVPSAFMAGQVALGTMLVVGATALAGTLRNLSAVDPGFRTDVMSVRAMNLGFARLRSADGFDVNRAWDSILDQVRGLPGVEAAGVTALHPMERAFLVDVRADGDGADRPLSTMFVPMSDGAREAMGIPLVEGRDLRRGDDASAPGVALVNREFVRRYLNGGPALGRKLTKGATGGSWGDHASVEVVGVVGDVRSQGPAGSFEPMMYVPLHQARFGYLRLVVRAAPDPFALVPALKDVVWAVDPTVPLADFALLEAAVSASVARERFLSRLVGVFAMLGLALAGAGVYGVVSHAVGARTREIGVRRAVGADAASVAALVARWCATRVTLGLAVGVAGTLLLRSRWSGLLFEVDVADPRLLAVVGAVMVVAAGLATLAPLRRAVRVDPVATLASD